jgi:hypothetical protein
VGIGGGHNDIIQIFESGGTSHGNPHDWTIRYNRFVMNSVENNNRSWTMLADLSGVVDIYGNVFLGIQGASAANGLNAHGNRSGVIFNIYGNTFVAKGSASNNTLSLDDAGTANIRNNVFHLQNQNALTGTMTKNRSHNLWYGSRIPSCSGITGEICGQDPRFTDYANNDFSLQSSSPAVNAGTNLGSPYGNAILSGSIWPGPSFTGRAGNWDIGAFEYNTAGSDTSPPSPPGNFRIR